MTRTASVLAVAMFLLACGLYYLHLKSEKRWGELIRETKIPMQELELKVQGGYTGRGVIAGFCGIIYENHEYWTPQNFPLDSICDILLMYFIMSTYMQSMERFLLGD